MTIAKNHQVLRSMLDKKVSENKSVTVDELAQFATVVRGSGRMSDKVLYVKAKRLLEEEQTQEDSNGTEQAE